MASSMQAIMVSGAGGPGVMRVAETDLPRPGPDEVLVRVIAAGVGPWDAYLRGGGWTGEFPYIPGAEFAGVVEGNTGDAAAFYDGEPVYGYPGLTGCHAQYAVCPAEQLAPIPEGLTPVEAAAVPVDGLTALQGLTDVLSVGRGDRVLITAGAGGMGHLAVQIARALGAYVIATASPGNREFVHKLGAEIVVDHTRPDWPDQVRNAPEGGVNRVLATVTPSLEGAARAARDGAIIATPVRALEFPEADRVQWRPFNGRPSGSGLIRLSPWFGDGSLSVHVSGRYYWKNAAAAHREVEQGHTRGKLVLIVDDDLAARLEV
jgi:NADPH:quinone reductase-like Zn-dependent oxidoreductase